MSRHNKQGATSISAVKKKRPSATASPLTKTPSPTLLTKELPTFGMIAPMVTTKAPTPAPKVGFSFSPTDDGWSYLGFSGLYVRLGKEDRIELLTPSEFFERNLDSDNLDEFYHDCPSLREFFILRHGDHLVPAFRRSDGTWRYGATDRTWMDFTFTQGGKLLRTEHGFCVDLRGAREYLDIVRIPKVSKHRRHRSSESLSSTC